MHYNGPLEGTIISGVDGDSEDDIKLNMVAGNRVSNKINRSFATKHVQNLRRLKLERSKHGQFSELTTLRYTYL